MTQGSPAVTKTNSGGDCVYAASAPVTVTQNGTGVAGETMTAIVVVTGDGSPITSFYTTGTSGAGGAVILTGASGILQCSGSNATVTVGSSSRRVTVN